MNRLFDWWQLDEHFQDLFIYFIIRHFSIQSSMQASYTAGCVWPNKENQPVAVQITARLTKSFPCWLQMSLVSYSGQQQMSLISYSGKLDQKFDEQLSCGSGKSDCHSAPSGVNKSELVSLQGTVSSYYGRSLHRYSSFMPFHDADEVRCMMPTEQCIFSLSENCLACSSRSGQLIFQHRCLPCKVDFYLFWRISQLLSCDLYIVGLFVSYIVFFIPILVFKTVVMTVLYLQNGLWARFISYLVAKLKSIYLLEILIVLKIISIL